MLVALVLPLLWLNLFSLPASPVVPELGSSWCGAVIHFSARGLQFGKDVVFTYGPLGHLITFVYTGELFSARVTWEFVSTSLSVAILGVTLLRLPALWRPVFFLFVLLFIWSDGISDSLYFLVISCLTVFLFKQGSSSSTLTAFAGALFAVFSLLKFTYFLLVIIALGPTLACYCRQRKPSRAILLGFVFVGSFLLSWWIAGQEYRHLFSYLSTSLDICFGYKEAMGLPAASTGIVLAGVSAAFLGILLCALLSLDSRQAPVLFASLFIAAETFLSWNRAFVRADDHVLSFFCLCPVVLLPMWIVAQPRTRIRRIGYAINLVVFVICLFGLFQQKPAVLTSCVRDTTERVKRSWQVATGPRAASAHLRTLLAGAKNTYALPRIRAEVREQTIDVFGYEQGVALLNDLNYTPRPIFQGYSSYTAKLINLNTTFYSSANAPTYVLFKYQSIDDRYPTLDDAGVLKQLLFSYKPLFEEKGYFLWKKIQPAKPVQSAGTISESLTFDSEHAVQPNEMLWLQLDIRKSLQGRALGLLYRPTAVTIRVTDRLGRRANHRLIPSMSSTGFIVNPYLMTSGQVLRTAGGAQKASVVSFSVHVPKEARRFFQRNIVCRMTVLPEVPKSELDDQARRMGESAFVETHEESQDWLTQAFSASGEVLLRLDPENHFEGVTPSNETRLANGENGLRITAMGTDPQILLPPFSTGSQGGALVRINLKVPTDTGFQVFYLPSGVSTYGNHVLNRSLRRGENTIYFFLTDSQLAGGRLRVDPGMSAGNYVITNLEARAVNPESLSDP